MRIFLTEAAYKRHVAGLIASEPDAPELMLRYSENPALLKKALAAYSNVDPKAIDRCNIRESELLFRPLQRAIRAYAAGLREMRAALSNT